jgi:hypothetical protein
MLTPQNNTNNNNKNKPSTNPSTMLLFDLCPKSWIPIMDPINGNLLYHWHNTPIVQVLGKQRAFQICNIFYSRPALIFNGISGKFFIAFWFVGLFDLIPPELMLTSAIFQICSIIMHQFCQIDQEIVLKTILFNSVVISTLILAIIFGLMIAFILDWDLRGIANLLFVSSGSWWSLSTQAVPTSLRIRNGIITHILIVPVLIGLALILNLGLIPRQLSPSAVTLVSISSVGKYPISIDAYAIMNQAVTTLVFVEIHSILHARNGELMFARINMKGHDVDINENEPIWEEIGKWLF